VTSLETHEGFEVCACALCSCRLAPVHSRYRHHHTTTQELKKGGETGKAVVYFTAAWCGPCKRISPMYDDLSEVHPTISFGKVDVDANNQTAAACGISAMPTFQFFNNDVMVAEFKGADPSQLTAELLALQTAE
jgi:thioredoxin 1